MLFGNFHPRVCKFNAVAPALLPAPTILGHWPLQLWPNALGHTHTWTGLTINEVKSSTSCSFWPKRCLQVVKFLLLRIWWWLRLGHKMPIGRQSDENKMMYLRGISGVVLVMDGLLDGLGHLLFVFSSRRWLPLICPVCRLWWWPWPPTSDSRPATSGHLWTANWSLPWPLRGAIFAAWATVCSPVWECLFLAQTT